MLIIVATHPIQYQVPIWKELAKRSNIDFEVLYLTSHGVEPSYDIQFGKTIKWDIDLLEGYPSRFSEVHCPKKITNFWSAKLPKDFKSKIKSRETTHILLLGWNVRAFIEIAMLSSMKRKFFWLRAESNDLKVNQSLIKNNFKKLFLKYFFSRIDRFLTIGKANKRLYENFGITNSKFYSAPYCIENRRFEFQAKLNQKNRNSIRNYWNIKSNSFCILFVGKFIAKKRPGDIIEAVESLKKIDPYNKYHILFVGTGTLEGDLKKNSNVVFENNNKVGSNSLFPTASFTGFVNQSKISEAYVAADLLVLPSEADETWGLVVNEAMASGLPCVASDACGSSEDLVEEINPQFRYPLGEIESLAKSIKCARQNLPSKTLLKNVIDRYDFIHTVDTLEQLYKEPQFK